MTEGAISSLEYDFINKDIDKKLVSKGQERKEEI